MSTGQSLLPNDAFTQSKRVIRVDTSRHTDIVHRATQPDCKHIHAHTCSFIKITTQRNTIFFKDKFCAVACTIGAIQRGVLIAQGNKSCDRTRSYISVYIPTLCCVGKDEFIRGHGCRQQLREAHKDEERCR